MNMITKTFSLMALLAALLTNPAWAISMGEAKASGLVGERANGYLGAVKSPASADVKALINSINQKRRDAYTKGAAKAGVNRNVFEQRTGQRLQDRAPKGHYIELPNGTWKKK